MQHSLQLVETHTYSPDWVNDSHLVLLQSLLVSLIRHFPPLLLVLINSLSGLGSGNLNVVPDLSTTVLQLKLQLPGQR